MKGGSAKIKCRARYLVRAVGPRPVDKPDTGSAAGMDLVKRNAEIVALVKARKMPMREIAARCRLSTSSISLIAIRHGVHAQAADPKKVRAASKLIQRGMPLRHVAQTVGLDYQRLRHLLEKQGVYKVPPPNRPWSEREVRILRRD